MMFSGISHLIKWLVTAQANRKFLLPRCFITVQQNAEMIPKAAILFWASGV